MAKDQELEVHRAWLGLLQPVGLVVSPMALVNAGVFPDRDVIARQQALAEVCEERQPGEDREPLPCITDFGKFTEQVLDWQATDLSPADAWELVLPEETLRADWAVMDGDRPLMLVKWEPLTTALDEVPREGDLHLSPQDRFARLLHERSVAGGILGNGHELRLIYAPRGETAGHLTFPVPGLLEVSGRPLLSALHMLLNANRVFSAPDKRRLLDLMALSRQYQSEVSTKLAGQVLGALWELLRGFQAADEQAAGRLLRKIADDEPEQIYGGLLTVLLRLVFLLYAEDKGLMPNDAVYENNYSVTGLYQRLRDDAGHWPDTMDQRFGAWAWLLSLFRLVHDGGGHGAMSLPARHGQLFDGDEHPFLGRVGDGGEIPRVSDGCIYRVLDALLMLDGERLSYGALDVEQLGSVYEAMMGFAVEKAAGTSIGVRSDGQKPGAVRADPVVDVDALLTGEPAQRRKWLAAMANCDLGGKDATALQAATSVDGVVAALGRKVSRYTPNLIPPGGLYLQPTEERRRSGSHYTPRELTEPIVRTTLRPVLEQLGEKPTPEQILDLKVCDPAMGSGAFLVEACRQLAEKLLEAWNAHDCMPAIPSDEEPLLHARRLVAQRCLYGVDKNPFAVNLAKLSLWLVTLARDHAFTFLNHALKCGDSLVGLTREQIENFSWTEIKTEDLPLFAGCETWVDLAKDDRRKLTVLDDDLEGKKTALLKRADEAVDDLRLAGDLVVGAFLNGSSDRDRENKRLTMRSKVDQWRHKGLGRQQLQEQTRTFRARQGVGPLHWHIEFPEVFSRVNSGFDCVVGNPPFLGGSKISTTLGSPYLAWLLTVHKSSHGNGDLVAHFFRKAFDLLRTGGAVGLIATNTIGQGDTRSTGLRWICTRGGRIFEARRRVGWPGVAAVVVSVVHFAKGFTSNKQKCVLDGRRVDSINAFLFHCGGDNDPKVLVRNAQLSFAGSKITGSGFTFDDHDSKGVASSLGRMRELISSSTTNSDRIFPYIGGEELNESPTQAHNRYVINFADMDEQQAKRWPDLLRVLEEKVKSYRSERITGPWWQFERYRPLLYSTISAMSMVLANSQVSSHIVFAFQPTNRIFAHTLNVFALSSHASFANLQSRTHEVWSRFFSSSLEDRLRYTATDCFETFPFPPNWQSDPILEEVGKTYYEFRADLMVRNNEGLTKTYNRFHNPDERSPDIVKLRELHAAMDRAVLDAYGWTDIPTDCQFLLDYEIDEETWGTKKRPWRYRWPDEVHDEVLARLLDLNQKRAEEERLAGLTADKKETKGVPRKPKKIADDLTLFDRGQG